MKENQSFDRHEEHKETDDDQLRGSTMNEMIREVNGDPDMDLNDLRDSDDSLGRQTHPGDNDSSGIANTGNISGATGGRNSGVMDMDDQTAGGLESNHDSRETRVNLTPKTGMTGSDFDGQVTTS